jgi:hypothetical protein
VTADSCSWTDTCVEPNEGDNAAWCAGLAVGSWVPEYSAESCPTEGVTGWCAIPAGGDYTADATAYFYGDIDGEAACTAGGGTYTAA